MRISFSFRYGAVRCGGTVLAGAKGVQKLLEGGVVGPGSGLSDACSRLGTSGNAIWSGTAVGGQRRKVTWMTPLSATSVATSYPSSK